MLPLNPVTLQELINRFGENSNSTNTDNSIGTCLEGGRQCEKSAECCSAKCADDKKLCLPSETLITTEHTCLPIGKKVCCSWLQKKTFNLRNEFFFF